MQLGTRWDAGAEPPARLPDSVLALIAEAEAALPAPAPGVRPPRWTLTWLEGRPQLELDTGTAITVGHDGAARVRAEGEATAAEDDWP